MFETRSLAAVMTLVLGLVSVPGPVHATQHLPGGYLIAAQGQTSLEQAVKRVRKQTGGRILSANTVDKGGRKVHRIKVLMKNGRVRVINVNAGSGR